MVVTNVTPFHGNYALRGQWWCVEWRRVALRQVICVLFEAVGSVERWGLEALHVLIDRSDCRVVSVEQLL